ncbi:hypothetical protein LT85_p044 (plasmid) [Collimonas arenae]|uniref:Uncharacterized protein n=1 Tax=Collimonas arenae TaxID=279058 RepID=A0A0A1FHI3_9BURK|nr:hypothetical protein [Collimonas arenae]AIY44223.1 hypothetical protein LT85_p044 [Collimonas arenae]
MKFKPTPELNLVITVVSIISVLSVLSLGPDGLAKWVIAAGIVLVTAFVETKIETAFLAKDKRQS